MRKKAVFVGLMATVAFSTLVFAGRAAASEQVLYNFVNSSNDGHRPEAGLISDAAGNLYGTTTRGGSTAGGTVFELSPQSGGGWAQTELHAFHSTSVDGRNPYAGVVLDKAGNLYGTTGQGGRFGGGTVFELSPQSGGGWSEEVLYSFQGNGQDGARPFAGLIFDGAGNLYGTTSSGGSGVSASGTVFELAPQSGGGWIETVLYSFQDNGQDGNNPDDALVFDTTGNLYGTTAQGGRDGEGTVFELSPQSGGGWTETVIHSFRNNGEDGNTPFVGSLVFDAAGNLYGTTEYGGSGGYGTVFELSPGSGGGWTEKVLHSFNFQGKDGYSPFGGVILDTAGDLYGTAYYGGSHGAGSVFELSPKSGGGWTEAVLHSFRNGNKDGHHPYAGVILGPAGNLYGTTALGGAYGGGAVFEVTP